MRKSAPPLCIGLAVVAGIALLHISGAPPGDDIVIKNFQAQRAAFEKLSAMLRDDRIVQYVTLEQISMIGSTRPLALPSGTSWDTRFVEYVSLLKQSNALIALKDDDRICMTVWKWGAGALGSKLVNLCSANTGG